MSDVYAALTEAADRIERELICCSTDDPEQVVAHHDICRWAIASRNPVLSVRDGDVDWDRRYEIEDSARFDD